MNRNIGMLDQLLRIVAGLALMGLAFTGHIGWWGWIGAVLLLTALVSRCPAYSLFGWRTCATRSPR